MSIGELLSALGAKGIQLRRNGDELQIRGNSEALDPALISAMREAKPLLLEHVSSQKEEWWSPSFTILPEMLPLVQLTAEEIERVVSGGPGGASNIQDIYPLAPLQEGILFHHLRDEGADPYVVVSQTAFDSRARLDAHLRAMQAVVDRHDILRTAVMWEGLPEPVQVVWRKATVPVEEVELEPEAGDAAQQLYAQFNPRQYQMDLGQAPLMRIYIAHDPVQERWLLMHLQHHITMDHATRQMMQEEIEAHLLGKADALPAPLPFRDFVAQARSGVSEQEHANYFRQLLGDLEEPTTPFGLMKVQDDGSGIEEARLQVDAELARRVRERARKLEVSTASLFHVAWAQVLAKISGREDVTFGTVLVGRMQGGKGSDRAMGVFINTLPVRLRIDEQESEAVVRRAHLQLSELLWHEHASLALAQRCSAVSSPMPLFSALLNYRHGRSDKQARSEERKRAREGTQLLLIEERTNYPCSLSVDDVAEGFWLEAQMQSPIEPMRICEYMHTALASLTDALERAPNSAIGRLTVLPAKERQQLLDEWNATEVEYPRDRCVHELFEEQVERTPNAVAVVYEDEELSYAELNARANQLAHYLRKLGVKPDDLIGVCMERSVEMVVALLGVLKAGVAYVPLEPEYPVERLRFMIKDAGLKLVLSHHGLWESAGLDSQWLWIDKLQEELALEATEDFDSGLDAEALAYVIYTSGSTGQPKAAMNRHRGISNRLKWMQGAYGLESADRVLQKTPYSFDVSVWEFFWPLLTGAGLVIARPGGHRDSAYLVQLIQEAGVTTIHFVPSMLQVFVEDPKVGHCASLRRVICSGEALGVELQDRCLQKLRGVELHNLYGPTEASVDVTFWHCISEPQQRNVPLGRPIWNTQIYIVNSNLEVVPIGVSGEILIGGVGLGRGYLHRPELTAERFIPDPFARTGGQRLYRTGDVGRYRRDGVIEYLGRIDHQVKIRGYRIELGEIEARLREHAGVREAAVLAREDTPGDKRLLAYYTNSSATHPEQEVVGAEQLRLHLSASLPEYMVPAAFVRLESLPLTPNGKLDRKALPAPGSDAFSTCAYEPPQGEIETRLAQVWAEVLKLNPVGRHDNFFELGGHSLLAVRVMARVREALKVEVAIKDLFAHPVLSDLARFLASASAAELSPIVAVERGAHLPLSFAQQRLWFLAQMEGVSQAYHIPMGWRLKGDLDRTALRKALDRIVARHEALRTIFAMVDGDPVQRILSREESRFHLVEHDLRGRSDDQEELARLAAEEAEAGFDLETGPLIRGRLIRLAEEEDALLITMHHIVSDGWSLGVFTNELSTLYGAFVRGKADPLPELEIQYADYAVWQRKWIEGEILQQQAAYWKNALAGAPALLELPTNYPRPAQQDFVGALAKLGLNGQLTAGLKGLGRRHGATLYMTLLAGWAVLMSRLSGQQDVVIGAPTAHRHRLEVEGLIGFFVNTLAVRLDLSGSPRVSELLQQAKEQVLAAQQHQDIPFEQVVDLLNPVRSLSHTPLFQVMFGWQSNEQGSPQLEGIEAAPLYSPHRVARLDLSASLGESGGGIAGVVEYATSLFDAATMERYFGYFRNLLKDMVADDMQSVDRLTMLDGTERHCVLYDWNETRAEFPSDKCVHELFEQQAVETPAAIAVKYEDHELTYAELNERANQVAHHLISLNVQPDTFIGLCLERGFGMVISMLGILKAGAAYLPIDPDYPEERLRQVVKAAGIEIVLTQAAPLQALQTIPACTLIDVENDWPRIARQDTGNPTVLLTPANLAYGIFTSGSTGSPKPVAISHSALCNHMTWMSQTFELNKNDRILQKTPYTFDASVWEFYAPLLHGGMLVMARSGGHMETGYLVETVQKEEITILQVVPSVLELLSKEPGFAQCATLRVLFSGGEALGEKVAADVANKFGFNLVNLYGPTEVTIDATYWKVQPGASRKPAIGKPIFNTQVYVLDESMEPVPIGVGGELYIGGAGLANGYLGWPELTADKFVPNPLTADGGRLYRTGDRVRWRADGNLEFIGRIDNQVKLRGFRIEPGEIEAALQEHPAVRQAVVVVREDNPGDKHLVAYLEPRPETNLEIEELKETLRKRLPEYMVPGTFIVLEAFPQTVHGKLDRKALPAPEMISTAAWRAPRTPQEEILCSLFAEVLGLEKAGLDDHFFDLGGHSLMATRLVSRIRTTLGVELAIRTLFEFPTVGELGPRLRESVEKGRSPLAAEQRPEKLPLSHAQQRLWFIDRMEGTSAEYNMPWALRMKGELDRTSLERALGVIVERHESLRTRFVEVEGEPFQVIEPDSRIELALEDMSGGEESGQQERVQEALRNEAKKPFDLRRGPLLRVKLLRLGAQDHVLLRTMHHIVSDGWSESVFNHELMVLYEAFVEGRENPLRPLRVQYADFALWQRRWLEGGALDRGLSYWKEQLAGIPARLELPADRARPAMQTFGGEVCSLTLSSEQVAGLKRLSQDHQSTLYMTFLAVFGMLLSRYSGQDDIVVGSPIANRQEEQLEALIGFFVNSLVMRVRPRGEMSFGELLSQVRQTALAAYEHQDVPFERLVEELSPERSLNTTPLFQVMFALQNAPMGQQQLNQLEVNPVRGGEWRVRFDLEVHAFERGGEITVSWLYNRDLFERWRMEQMGRHYVRMLEAVVREPGCAVGRVEMLSATERHQLLYEWNDTATAFPADKCVHELFEEQVARTPDAVAVIFEGEELNYAQLNARANRLAHYLRELGVKPDERVAICLERGFEMIVALLAVLKAGGAYVPLDPDYPIERLRLMLQDAEPVALLTQTELRELLSGIDGKLPVVVLKDAAAWESYPEKDLDCATIDLTPDRLAYVIYTSGSTGVPKGVMVEHRAIVRLVRNTNYVQLSPDDVIAQASNASFDAATFEIWGALLAGARLVNIKKDTLLSPTDLARDIQKNKITTLFLTTALFNQIASDAVEAFANFRYLLFGGERVEPRWVERVLGQVKVEHLLHVYGPTETITYATWHEVKAVEEGKTVPIGRPISNTRVYILDAQGEPVPVGVAGELYIGGVGVARGYLNRPELTTEKFVKDPFTDDPNGRMYRTGDLARWLPDGNIEFLGRNDFQVKIRGFRIELGEIEAALRSDVRVQDAVVTVEGEGEEKRILGYVVAGTEEPEQDSQKTEFIEDWRQLYEGLYGQGRDAAGDLNLTGWQSSYSGEMIPVEEMRIWIEETVSQLRGLNPRRVLEVGCGTGLLLTRLAANCESYIGIDFSQEVLRQLKGYLSSRPDLSHVQLREGMAHELSFLGDDSVDLVILNSIVQYFPGTDYLLQALEQAVRVTKKGGHIFVGDVRNLALQDAFHASVQLYKAGADTTLLELRRLVRQGKRKEKELLIDAELFAELGRSWKKVGRVKAGLKKGDYDNELSRFRYNVVLEIGEKEEIAAPDRWVDWDKDGAWRGRLEEMLALRPESGVGVRGIRDARTAWAVEAVRLIDGEASDVSNAVQLKELCAEVSGEDPNAVMQWAAHLGVEYCWRGFGKDGIYEAIFNPHWQRREIRTEPPRQSYRKFGNSPARNMAEGGLGQVLRDNLRSKLPEYMVPATVIVLEAWPLTPNGKLDRKALPAPEMVSTAAWRAPRTPQEEILCSLFAEVLGLEKAGLDDHFFDLGGHSLMATRLVSRIRTTLGVELAIRTLFEFPTVGELGPRLRESVEEGRSPLAAGKRPEKLPLSHAQQRLWFINRLEGTSAEYNMTFALRLKGELDRTALQQALKAIVERHESLRTRFVEVEGEPYQVIEPDCRIELALEDFSGGEESAQQERVQEALRSEARMPFDLMRGPMLRVKLLRLGAQDHVLLRTMHHIVSDGWSEGVFNHELMVLYEAFVEGRENPLRPLKVQYADFALWQRRWLEGGALERGLSYWKEQLAGIPARLELPADRARPAMQTFGGEVCGMTLSAEQVAGLKRLSQDHQSTLYMTLLAVFGMLLSRYSGQDDIVVGSPIANRQEEQLEALIGFFINSLVMRVRLRGEMSFGALLSEVRRTALAAYEHQDVPFERLVEELSPERSLNATPLFQVVFALQNAPLDKQQLKQLEVNPVRGGELRVRFDLEVHAYERGGEIALQWWYNRDLFDRWRMEQMARHYVRMLEAVVREPGCAVGRVEMLSATERHQLLYEWNDTATAFPADKCVHELFEEQVARTPDAVAVVFEGEELNYAQLNARANQLAHYLRKMGVGTGDTVAVLLERSINLVVAEIAVLKCSAAYVPIDPFYAEERKAFLISDCQARAVIVCEETALPEGLSAARVNIDKVILDEEATTDLYTPLDGEALAYIMYTSGSTGQPKGVMVPHRGITRLIWNNNYAQFTKDDRVAFGVNPSFDVSTLEVWAPLLNGGCIVVIKQKTLLDPVGFGRMLEQQRVNILWLTVGLFNQYSHILQKQFAGLRYLMSGGDVLDPAVVARVLSSHAPQHLLNGYGPTESTTFTTTYEIAAVREDGSSIPIGRPISNTQVYILDAQREPVPIGVVGELYVGGAGVALGYLNRPELTAEKFVQDPFSGEAGARMYRTGDLARWLPDSNIEFLGRNDFQVKIRGFRIELGEIEARLAKHPAVREAVVIAREERPGDKRLVAYYTTSLNDGSEANAPNAEQLRAFLSASVPEYMVPAAFIALEAWPLTSNGKLDRRALPAPEMDFHAVHSYEPPQGDVETMLAAIWAETLRLDQVNRHDDFFRLGGHSLLTLRVVTLLQQRGFIITVADIFANPTIASLAAKLKTRERPDSADIAIQINGGSADRPLFLSHCGNGELLYASALAPHIDRNIPLYGLPAMPADQAQPETIEEMATRMVRMIRSVQPAGPYRIAGWSGGGTIAYEIATQLIGAHEEVEFIAMFDTLCPLSSAMARRARVDFNDSAFLLDVIESAGTERDGRKAALDSIRASLHTMDFADVVQECDRLSLIPDTLRYLNIAQTRLKLARTHSLAVAAARYQPHPLHIPVHFFPALDAQDSGSSDPHRGWNDVVPDDQLRITPVPGSHHSMLRSPNVELLGRSLTQAICQMKQ
jgi:amino acid adenylation domain-containing protein